MAGELSYGSQSADVGRPVSNFNSKPFPEVAIARLGLFPTFVVLKSQSLPSLSALIALEVAYLLASRLVWQLATWVIGGRPLNRKVSPEFPRSRQGDFA